MSKKRSNKLVDPFAGMGDLGDKKPPKKPAVEKIEEEFDSLKPEKISTDINSKNVELDNTNKVTTAKTKDYKPDIRENIKNDNVDSDNNNFDSPKISPKFEKFFDKIHSFERSSQLTISKNNHKDISLIASVKDSKVSHLIDHIVTDWFIRNRKNFEKDNELKEILSLLKNYK